MSDPNSQHQKWSKWIWLIHPGRVVRRSTADVEANLRRAFQTVTNLKTFFRSGTMMRLRVLNDAYVLEALAEGIDAHDPTLAGFIQRQLDILCLKGFGAGTVVEQSVTWLAGDRQDGKPRDQLILMPSISLETETHGELAVQHIQTKSDPR